MCKVEQPIHARNCSRYLATKRPKWPVPLTEGVPSNGHESPQKPGSKAAPSSPEKAPAPPPRSAPPTSPVRTSARVPSKQNGPPTLLANGTGKDTAAKIGPALEELRSLQSELEKAETARDHLEQQRDEERASPPKEADPNNPHYAFGVSTDRDAASAMVRGRPDGTFLLRQKAEGWSLCVVFQQEPTHHSISSGGGVLLVNNSPMGRCKSLEALVNYMRKPLPNWPVALQKGIANPQIPKPVRSHTIDAKLTQAQKVVKDCAAAVSVQQRKVDVLQSVAGVAAPTVAPVTKKTDAEQAEILKRSVEGKVRNLQLLENRRNEITSRIDELNEDNSEFDPSEVSEFSQFATS